MRNKRRGFRKSLMESKAGGVPDRRPPISEDSPNGETMGAGRRYGHDEKVSGINFPLLRRFLASHVGHTWDCVHSEICEMLRGNNRNILHAKEWIIDQVAKVYLAEDGRYYEEQAPHYPVVSGEFYVNPSGILERETRPWPRPSP